MQALHGQRRAALAMLIEQGVPKLVLPRQEAAELFITMVLRADVARVTTGVAIAAAAGQEGMHVEPLSALYTTEARKSGLIFGFGGFPEQSMQAPLQRLASIIRAAVSGVRGTPMEGLQVLGRAVERG